MNEVILKNLMSEIEKNRNESGRYYALNKEALGRKFEHIAVGLEQAYRIIANEQATNPTQYIESGLVLLGVRK